MWFMNVIKVSKDIYELLTLIAQRKGKSVEELILESIVKELDPRTRFEVYLKLHEKYLREAEELYGKGDLVQAGEKYWGALVSLLNIIGEKEDLPHYTHRDLRDIVEFLTEKTNDSEYSRLFSSAEALHQNYYHNFMSKLSFDIHREDTLKLIQKLRKLIERKQKLL